MASSPGDHNSSQPSQAVQQRILSQLQGDWVDRLSVAQMFILIDRVLPVEACLYYQILPLFLEGSLLYLGMVNPRDPAAAEYARRIVSYLNYSVMPRSISSEALQATLTAYLSHVGSHVGKQATERASFNHSTPDAVASGTSSTDQAPEANPGDRNTLIVDSPEELDSPSLDQPSLLKPSLSKPGSSVSSRADLIIKANASFLRRNSQKPAGIPASSAPRSLPPLESLPVLTVQAHHPGSPLQTLSGLPPLELLQELLVRVLADGIGRLYFECHAGYGRVLWSQDGVLQSVLEGLPLAQLRGMIKELKQVVHLPPQPVERLRQAEAEYLYDHHRILLCCRFMPSNHGEEATVQVLRGAALKFYQQQQVSKLERDALSIANQLQNKLKEIRNRTHAEPGLVSAKSETLPALSQLLQGMEELLDDLGVQKTEE
ncbi:hypothetical protein IFO70_03695 [Phormidium tenue FACHB-886]|nr:hypothetical protein [Phormidium tenue FACHB-886]